MKWMNDKDPLLKEDWAKVYSDTPPCVEDGMNMAFRRIRARRVQEKKWRAVAACAACAVLALGVGAWVVSGKQQPPDRVVDPYIQAPETYAPHERILLYADSAVYTTKEDGCFHISQNCPDAPADMVELQLITAQEFGKTACEVCCPNVVYDLN